MGDATPPADALGGSLARSRLIDINLFAVPGAMPQLCRSRVDCERLAAVHRQGITHRDLKPANILVTRQGIKLLDFGLARVGVDGQGGGASEDSANPAAESPTVAQPLTAEHMILGTVQYMSPEQAQGKPADARSDLFSFGLVLYEMLTGRRAFDAKNSASVIAAILERDAPSVAAVAPRGIDVVLQKCLAKDPSERWRAARDVRHALDLVEEAPATGRTFGQRTLAAASIAALIAACALGTLLWASRPSSAVPGRRLSFHLSRPGGVEFQFSATSGGSAISPDGGSVAFVAGENGTSRLWIRSLDSPTAREIEDTDGAKLPFWSPDSRSLAFFANGDLRTIEVAGGTATVLARAPDPRGGAWSTDGTIVFTPTSAGPLQRISTRPSGGSPTPLTRLAEGESSHRWPQFLPDGRTILYFSQGSTTNVHVTTLERPPRDEAIAQFAIGGHVLHSAAEQPGVPGLDRREHGRGPAL